ncbi:hypothetical protein OAT76_00455 [Flavobacteriaceae bacterium]|nr:hypothetical protein [Flavobacteriaceae bacterium]
MSTDKNNNEEEVDLGSLFVIIGKGFKNFFNFIESIFKGAFHFLISILLFFKKHFKKILIPTLLGFIVGVCLEYSKEKVYGSNLLVQPNFNSTKQLYNNINYYNDLVKQGNFSLLASIFKIDTARSSSLRKFEISPIIRKIDVINSYDRFVTTSDSLTVNSFNFYDFNDSFSDYDYYTHEIQVEATINDVFLGLDEVIIASVVNNNYFNQIKKLKNEQFQRTDSLLRVNLIEVDSLRNVYMSVMIEEAKNSSTGTSIDLGGSQKTTKEIELFDTDQAINNNLIKISEDIAQKSEVINVISNFQPIGSEIKGFTKNYGFLLGFFGSVLMIVSLLLIHLNKFLDNYKK